MERKYGKHVWDEYPLKLNWNSGLQEPAFDSTIECGLAVAGEKWILAFDTWCEFHVLDGQNQELRMVMVCLDVPNLTAETISYLLGNIMSGCSRSSWRNKPHVWVLRLLLVDHVLNYMRYMYVCMYVCIYICIYLSNNTQGLIPAWDCVLLCLDNTFKKCLKRWFSWWATNTHTYTHTHLDTPWRERVKWDEMKSCNVMLSY